MLENIWHDFTWNGWNSHEIVDFISNSLCLWGPIIGTKFRISCEFGLHDVKLQYHMFSSLRREEYMESELSRIFRAKLVAKNITELSLQCDVSSWWNIQMFWTGMSDFSVFLVK